MGAAPVTPGPWQTDGVCWPGAGRVGSFERELLSVRNPGHPGSLPGAEEAQAPELPGPSPGGHTVQSALGRRQGPTSPPEPPLPFSVSPQSAGGAHVLSRPHSNLKLAERTLFEGLKDQSAFKQDTKLNKTVPARGKDHEGRPAPRSSRALPTSEGGG